MAGRSGESVVRVYGFVAGLFGQALVILRPKAWIRGVHGGMCPADEAEKPSARRLSHLSHVAAAASYLGQFPGCHSQVHGQPQGLVRLLRFAAWR